MRVLNEKTNQPVEAGTKLVLPYDKKIKAIFHRIADDGKQIVVQRFGHAYPTEVYPGVFGLYIEREK